MTDRDLKKKKEKEKEYMYLQTMGIPRNAIVRISCSGLSSTLADETRIKKIQIVHR